MDVTFRGERLQVEVRRYQNGAPAVLLFEPDTGIPWGHASVNLPFIERPSQDTTFIRMSGLYDGVLQVLIEAGLVTEVHGIYEYGLGPQLAALVTIVDDTDEVG